MFAKAVGSYLPKLTQKAFERHGFSTATLITGWAGIVGADWARGVTPERLVWPVAPTRGDRARRQAATLVLSVDPSRALETEYRASQIVERINVYFGYRAVERLRLRQEPMLAHRPVARDMAVARRPEPPPTPELLAIRDPALRDALARLRASVMRGTGF